MPIELHFDTETSGMVDWNNPSDGDQQPHIVQLAAALVDTADDFKVRSFVNLYVRPEGWEWSMEDEAAQIHGITPEFATQWGIGERDAVGILLEMWQKATVRWMFNEVFDARIVRIALKRYGWPQEWMDAWHDAPRECTMRKSAKHFGAGKTIKLVEAYERAFGENPGGWHDALHDLKASIALRRWLAEQGAD